MENHPYNIEKANSEPFWNYEMRFFTLKQHKQAFHFANLMTLINMDIKDVMYVNKGILI